MNTRLLLTRVGYAYIPTTDIEASIRWYTGNLELRLIDKFEDRGSAIAVLHYPHKNAIALLLVETSERRPLEIDRNGTPFPVMAMNCPDIEHTYETLKRRGVEIVRELSSLGEGKARFFYFRDNEGNLLEGAWSVWDPEDELKDGFAE
ncbi:VOC family protein [Paenibacillus flagellatus]|uniref:VOC family protein n=1 Tax=Paenibacillus flagellatus TaxID=2211139 RepID=A0A2V5K9V7_9BACL|nr:VOC family protein [Paenibacillus flagellatus]PYI55672.1 VOC family protein [Paenibacillus flagellatus]